MTDDQPTDVRDDVDGDSADRVGLARRSHRRLIAVGLIVTIALLAGIALTPRAVRPGSGRHGASLDVGQAVYSGLAGSIRAPIQLLWVHPVAVAWRSTQPDNGRT